MNYMGIDHHNQYSHITVMDEAGEVIRSEKVANLRCEVERFLTGIKRCQSRDRGGPVELYDGRSTE